MLVINQLSKQYHGKKIVDAISLTVQPGEIALLLGSSGVGKSTLLRILNNLETIDAGTVQLNGTNLLHKQKNSKPLVGMVFQHFNLFEQLTAAQNITLALELVAHKTKDEARTIAHHLLNHYGLQDKADAYPAQLSGGQKQRLALARTLALKPPVICLDEPTSALDPVLTSSVAQTIQELAEQKYIVLVASHDISLLEKLPCTVYLMQQGKIVEKAQSADLFAHQEQYPHITAFIKGVAHSI